MANLVYNHAKTSIFNQTLDLATDTIKVLLMDSTYSADIDLDFVADGGAASATSHECTGTGYAEGHGNAGRLTVSVISIATDDTNNRSEAVVSLDNLWLALTLDTDISGALIIKEGSSNDTDAIMIAFIDTVDGGSPESFPYTTAGNDLRIVYNAEGLLQLT